MKLTVEKISEVYIRVYGDVSCEQDLEQFFTYEVPGARFTPKFKARLWDGKVRLYSLIRKTLYVGLYAYLVEFAKRHNYVLEFKPTEEFPTLNLNNEIPIEDIDQYVKDLDLYARGQPIPARDYQIQAIHHALTLN